MILGFTAGHRERIGPGAYGFSKFSEFFEDNDIQCLRIDGQITSEGLKSISAVVIGSPQHRIRQTEYEALRQYVADGGRVFILMKFGGDSKLNANIRKFFPAIQPNKDEVYDPKLFDPKKKYQDVYEYICMKPVIPVSIRHPLLKFDGEIIYDSGCTFSTEGDMTLTVMPREDLVSYSNPELGVDIVHYDITQGEKLKQVMGPIFVYNKIGKGSVMYWGARWSFSDEHWDTYDNAEFFNEIMSLFLGKRLYHFPLDDASNYYDYNEWSEIMTRYKGNEKETVTKNKERMERKLSVGDSFTLKGKIYQRVDARKHDGKKWILKKETSEGEARAHMKPIATSKKLIKVKSLSHFDNIVKTYPNIIIDFTASWCGPCQMLKPVLKRLNSEIDDVQIITVDVDELEAIADVFDVMSMPTLVAMNKGRKQGDLKNRSYTPLRNEIRAKLR